MAARLIWRGSVPEPQLDDGEGGPAPSAGAMARLIERLGHGNANAALAEVVRENRDYRARHRRDKEEIAALKLKLPPDGGIVLPSDQTAAYQAFMELKMTPAQVKQLVTEHATLKAAALEHAELSRIDEAARAMNWKASVLRGIAKANGLAFEMRDVQRPMEGDPTKTETVRMAHVRPAADDKAEWKLLADYAAQHLVDFMPALEDGESRGGPTTRPSESGVKFPKQPVGGAPAKGSGPSRDQAERAKRSSGAYAF
jgi:hypothetical protein